MESSRDYNREQMAGSVGDLEVTALAAPINKVLLFFLLKIHTFQDMGFVPNPSCLKHQVF